MPSSFSGSNSSHLHRFDLFEELVFLSVLLYRNHVARFYDIGGNIHRSAVDRKVGMVHELSRLRARRADSHTENDVVETAFEQGKHVLARDALHSHRNIVIVAEQTIKNAVNTLGLQLYADLQAVFGNLLSARAVLSGRRGAFIEGALLHIALFAF